MLLSVRVERALTLSLKHTRTHLFGDEGLLPDVRLGQLLPVEARFEAGEGGDAQRLEELGDVGTLRQRLGVRHLLLHEPEVDARLLHVFQRDGARGGLACARQVKVDGGRGGHDDGAEEDERERERANERVASALGDTREQMWWRRCARWKVRVCQLVVFGFGTFFVRSITSSLKHTPGPLACERRNERHGIFESQTVAVDINWSIGIYIGGSW